MLEERHHAAGVFLALIVGTTDGRKCRSHITSLFASRWWNFSGGPFVRSGVAGRLDRLHARIVRIPFLVLFAAIVRVLLALAFLPSGLVKLRGDRFTLLPVTTPVGFFFEGFFQAPGYYRFVGAMQLVAAALLLFPATAPLGAALYLPIIVNIFAITLAIGFGNTTGIAGLLLLGNVFLLCWDYDRWRALLPSSISTPGRHLGPVRTWTLFAAAAAGFVGMTRLHLAWLHRTSMLGPALLVVGGGLVALATMWTIVSEAQNSER